MLNDTFANRLQKAINSKNIKPIELSKKTGIDKSQISNYLSGNYKANSNNLTLLADALGVSETWLLGYDENIYVNANNKKLDELELLFSKYKNILTDDDKATMKFLIEKRIKEIDEQNNNK